jgi:hypothetical protein
VQRERFSHYTPVVDLMHAIAYVYTAAIESTLDMNECWQRYCRWMPAVWLGEARRMLPELGRLIGETENPECRATLQDCHTYLSHNAPRMRYHEYRRQGLPITTTLGESKMKQINRRVKGTEKSWRAGGEPQLQLCCDHLSDTAPPDSLLDSPRRTPDRLPQIPFLDLANPVLHPRMSGKPRFPSGRGSG